VPQIIGKTRDDVTWGAGWVIAEDRGLLLQQARYDSLVAAINAPGLNALNLVGSLRNFKPSAQTEREVAKQTDVLRTAGPNGRGVLHDLHVYLQGINAFIDAHGDTLGLFSHVAHFTLVDIYAFNALKDQFVGEGGGQEAVNSEFLSALWRRPAGYPRVQRSARGS
jgi:acyl-homoserine lactone acylase PvdQ